MIKQTCLTLRATQVNRLQIHEKCAIESLRLREFPAQESILGKPAKGNRGNSRNIGRIGVSKIPPFSVKTKKDK